MAFLTVLLLVVAYIKEPHLPLEGIKAGARLFWGILPAMVLAFIAAGIISMVIPQELMSRLLGEESGLRGLIVANLAGSLTPGGPFVRFPIVAAFQGVGRNHE